MTKTRLALALILLTSFGCASAPKADLATIYGKAARDRDAHRNPVIVIPGILGSKLKAKDGRIVWGALVGRYADPDVPRDARAIALPIGLGDEPLVDLRDEVRSDGALDTLEISLLGIPLSFGAYVGILKTLGVGGYVDEELPYGDDHFTCFQFDYDWRRDNVENARLLHEFILEKKAFVEAENLKRFGHTDAVRFDIVAHSMGGLVSRYYLRYGDTDLPADGSTPTPTWKGTKHVERLVMVGTPNAGSADAIVELIEGANYGPIVPSYPPALLGTFPAIYQLLPRGRHHVLTVNGKPRKDLLDPALWIKEGWGLADPDQDEVLQVLLPKVTDPKRRRALAIAHLRKILARARQFHAALDLPAEPPPGVELVLFAGDAIPTSHKVDVRGREVEVTKRSPGDGTVLRTSALLDEREDGVWRQRLQSPITWKQVVFLFTDHVALTQDPEFVDNVLYILLEDPRPDHHMEESEDPDAPKPPADSPASPEVKKDPSEHKH